MDSKRDLDGEKRLIRNEKARRRRALQYACRYLPIELEKKIFNYMKNPRNGRIDVSMKWQKHPVAKLFGAAPTVLDLWQHGSFSYITDQHEDWHENSYITHLTQMLAKYPHGDTSRQCKLRFTPRMQLTIARKAFDIAFRNIVSFDFKIMPCGLHYQKTSILGNLQALIAFSDWRIRLMNRATWLTCEDFSREMVAVDIGLARGALRDIGHRLLNASDPEMALQDLKMELQDLRIYENTLITDNLE